MTGNISDITKNVSDAIENIGKIGETIESIISSTTALGITVGTMGKELADEIAAVAAIGAGAVSSIEILTGTFVDLEIPKLPINAVNVNYTKPDESIVPLDTYLKNIVSDIQATGDYINQLFPLSATNVNYTNVENKVKTV
jgi:hypothetical protein